MPENQENKVKIRFKFKSGEEFEAEGNPDFIEKQRADFLQLIGKNTTHAAVVNLQPKQAASATYPQVNLHPQAATGYAELTDDFQLPPATRTRSNHLEDTEQSAFSNATRTRAGRAADIRLWEQIVRVDDRRVYLRRKSRLLTPASAALLLIAAAKVLLDATEGYSALALSKSLKKSGYGGERLDRSLAGEIKQGTLLSQGSKRSRSYYLSDEGFVRAYVLAGKLANEWR